MHHIRIFKTADHMDDSSDLTDMAEEFISQAFPLGGAFYKSRNIIKLNGGIDCFLGIIHLMQDFQTFVRNGYNAHIGFDGAKRVISSLGTSLCNRIKQRTF